MDVGEEPAVVLGVVFPVSRASRVVQGGHPDLMAPDDGADGRAARKCEHRVR